MSSTNTYSQQYCVYITHYSGDLLPQNYIGSSTVDKINNGYYGSVRSKKYKSIWESELKDRSELFSIEIISTHDTRREATYKELQLQRIFNVVKSDLFVNLSYAAPNGYFGRDVLGKNNPMYGKGYILKGKYKGIPNPKTSHLMQGNTRAKGIPKSEEHKRKLSESNKGKHNRPWSYEEKLRMSTQRKNRKWYNDGIRSYLVFENQIESHYTKGRLTPWQ